MSAMTQDMGIAFAIVLAHAAGKFTWNPTTKKSGLGLPVTQLATTRTKTRKSSTRGRKDVQRISSAGNVGHVPLDGSVGTA